AGRRRRGASCGDVGGGRQGGGLTARHAGRPGLPAAGAAREVRRRGPADGLRRPPRPATPDEARAAQVEPVRTGCGQAGVSPSQPGSRLNAALRHPDALPHLLAMAATLVVLVLAARVLMQVPDPPMLRVQEPRIQLRLVPRPSAAPSVTTAPAEGTAPAAPVQPGQPSPPDSAD